MNMILIIILLYILYAYHVNFFSAINRIQSNFMQSGSFIFLTITNNCSNFPREKISMTWLTHLVVVGSYFHKCSNAKHKSTNVPRRRYTTSCQQSNTILIYNYHKRLLPVFKLNCITNGNYIFFEQGIFLFNNRNISFLDLYLYFCFSNRALTENYFSKLNVV